MEQHVPVAFYFYDFLFTLNSISFYFIFLVYRKVKNFFKLFPNKLFGVLPFEKNIFLLQSPRCFLHIVLHNSKKKSLPA